jgi:hypothetical protein
LGWSNPIPSRISQAVFGRPITSIGRLVKKKTVCLGELQTEKQKRPPVFFIFPIFPGAPIEKDTTGLAHGASKYFPGENA